MNDKGFTLIELLIVVGILGLLATLGLTIYTPFREKAQCRDVVAAVHDAMVQAVAEVAENNVTPAASGDGFDDDHMINGVVVTFPANVQVSITGAGTVANQLTVSGQRTDFVCPEGDGTYVLNEDETHGTW